MSNNFRNESGPNRRHIPISQDRIGRDQKESSGHPPFPEKKDNTEWGRILTGQLDHCISNAEREGKIADTEPILFVVQTTGPIEQEDTTLNRLYLRFSLQLDKYAAAVSLNNDGLGKLKDEISIYSQTDKLKSYFGRIERISTLRLKKTDEKICNWLNSNDSRVVEIKLLPNLGRESYTSILNNVTAFLYQKNEHIYNSRVSETTASIRASLRPETAKAILQGVDSVWQITEAPTILVDEPQGFEIEELPTPRISAHDSKTICVLDAGITETHPFLEHVLLQSVDLTDDGDMDDPKGHGTFVAGLAAYGSFENRYETIASANIICAKVHGRINNSYPYLERRIERAVEMFKDKCKIFTLSVMYPQCTSLSNPSDLAFTIDTLSNKFNVLFTISSGNIEDRQVEGALSKSSYPDYLSADNCKVFCGAESAIGIAVGGIANRNSRTLAKKGQPSPFTRRGEFNERAKPDVVAYAGNQEIGDDGKVTTNVNLAIASLNKSGKGIAYGLGTSYSTPAIANMLAQIQREYPNASANLLKALLIHFASLPETNQSLQADEPLKKALYGKGLPEFEKCIYSQPFAPAYIVEDSVRLDEVAYIPIYVPYSMSSLSYEKRMRVTLVYNPPVDIGAKGYTLVDLDFDLFKPIKNKQTKKYIPKRQTNWSDDFRRPWDNVKTDVFRWQKEGWGLEWSLMISPKARFKTQLVNYDAQEYAVVITLEDPNKRLDIYDSIVKAQHRITKPLEAYTQPLPVLT